MRQNCNYYLYIFFMKFETMFQVIYQMFWKGCINRDKNGCNNIQKVFKSYIETGERPEKYKREYKFQ